MAARLPYIERGEVAGELQRVYGGLQQVSGRVLNIFKLMAYRARSFPRFLQWYPALREGTLDLGLRQLAYMRVSQLNRCRY